MESSTFKINQDTCLGCEACIAPSQDQIGINDDCKAYFKASGTDTVNVGDTDATYIFEAISACPTESIEEIG